MCKVIFIDIYGSYIYIYIYIYIYLVSVCICVQSLLSCPTLCDPMDCSQSSSSVHRLLQGKILEWAATPSSRGSSRLKNQTCVSCVSYTVGEFFTTEPPGKPLIMCIFELYYCIDFLFCELCSQCEPFCRGGGGLKRRRLDKTKSMVTRLCMLALKTTGLSPVLDYMKECCFVIT